MAEQSLQEVLIREAAARDSVTGARDRDCVEGVFSTEKSRIRAVMIGKPGRNLAGGIAGLET